MHERGKRTRKDIKTCRQQISRVQSIRQVAPSSHFVLSLKHCSFPHLLTCSNQFSIVMRYWSKIFENDSKMLHLDKRRSIFVVYSSMMHGAIERKRGRRKINFHWSFSRQNSSNNKFRSLPMVIEIQSQARRNKRMSERTNDLTSRWMSVRRCLSFQSVCLHL